MTFPYSSDLGSPLNSLPLLTLLGPSTLRAEAAHNYPAVPPALTDCIFPPSPYPGVSTPKGDTRLASWVVPSCAQTFYIQQALETGVPLFPVPSWTLCPSMLLYPWQAQMPSPPPQGCLAGKAKATSFYNRLLFLGEA